MSSSAPISATLMAANIAHAIAPAQKRRLARLRAGQPADQTTPESAGVRALHNQYLALPMVFFMLSGHAPLLFAGPWNGVAAAIASRQRLSDPAILAASLIAAWVWTGDSPSRPSACLLLGLALSAPRRAAKPKKRRRAMPATPSRFALRPGVAEARAHCRAELRRLSRGHAAGHGPCPCRRRAGFFSRADRWKNIARNLARGGFFARHAAARRSKAARTRTKD